MERNKIMRPLLACWGLLLVPAVGFAQLALPPQQTRALQPGQTTRVTVTGPGFAGTVRGQVFPLGTVTMQRVEGGTAELEIALPAGAIGPVSLYVAHDGGPYEPIKLFAEDLPAFVEAGSNQSLATAQELTVPCAVDGNSEATHSDYYRFSVAAGQRLAFEVHAQVLASPLDAVLQLWDASGRPLAMADDSEVGPDARLQYTFSEAGSYVLEVRDSRYAAGGAYHLRIGDFPAVSAPFPFALLRGNEQSFQFIGADAADCQPLVVAAELTAGVGMRRDSVHWVAAKLKEGKFSSWLPVQVVEVPHHIESETAQELTSPVVISGLLTNANERDSYLLSGGKGQVVRISSKTRSIGCGTLLQMQLFNASGAKIGETAVTQADEWSFDVTFPEDGVYRLEVADLLRRGGSDFGYLVEVRPAGTFTVSLKADAKVREIHAVEATHGGCAFDLVVQRFGYDGEIELLLEPEVAGVRITNPRIAAGANEHRVILAAAEQWSVDALQGVRLVAKQPAQAGTEGSSFATLVGNRDWRKMRFPHVPFPEGGNESLLVLGGAAASEPFFALETSAPVELPKPFADHVLPLTLKRIKPEFKEGVHVFAQETQAPWSTAVAVENDTYKVTATLANGELTKGQGGAFPEAISLRAFAEFQGRGRLETVQIPVKWFDPLQVQLSEFTTLVAGQTITALVTVTRAGNDPQPVTVRWGANMDGFVAGEPVVIPADQTKGRLQLTLPTTAMTTEQLQQGIGLSVSATTTYSGRELTVASDVMPIRWDPPPTRLEVFPQEVSLVGAKDQAQIVVTGFDDLEMPRDWTRLATITCSDPNVVQVEQGVVRSVGNGAAEIVVQAGSLQHRIPVVVQQFEVPQRIEFENDVLVALSKQNCNSGACHGSPSGKGGFRLSLRAFDPQLDTLTLLREEFGRRINVVEPEKSLLLEKPIMRVGHGGGLQLRKEDVAYEILRDWIAGGAKGDPQGTARCVKLEVYPAGNRMMRLKDGSQQLSVIAHFADGRQRDVTRLVAYESSSTAVATVGVAGLVTPQQRGEAAILVRYLEHIESIPMMFIDEVPGFAWSAPEPKNYVDIHVHHKLQQLQYLPSEPCTDAEFIRRVYLDVIGLLPAVEETEAFLADSSVDKRSRLIDQLLERPEYAKFWALKWGDLLQMTNKMVGDSGVYKYHRWVENAFRENMPYDQFARELLTASGSTLSNPPANFYRTAVDMNSCVETISQVFLGARLQCAKCHNHPFERWTQDNYYGLGSFFQRVQRKPTERPGEMFIWSAESGEVTQPRTGQVMRPWLPKQGELTEDKHADRRAAFAEWLVQPENPYLARMEVNRIWAQLFARGIVDPIDDFRDSNPPTNEALLDALAADFVEHGFDRKHILRVILNSQTYQASYQPNEMNKDDLLYCSHQEPRLLSAEQLLDAVNQATGLSQNFGHLPPGTKATHLPAPDIVKVDFLKVFGQPERSTVCACERADDSSLGMAIELFNGSVIHEKLRDGNNRFRQAIAAGRSVDETIREMYLAALCREPSAEEMAAAVAHCRSREDVVAGLEDVCWALLNTDEFLFQH